MSGFADLSFPLVFDVASPYLSAIPVVGMPYLVAIYRVAFTSIGPA